MIRRKSFATSIAALALAALTTGCSSIESLLPTNTVSTGATSVRSGGTAGPARSDAEKIKVLPLSAGDLDCPTIDIADGGATFRVGGPDNKTVRYQFDISDVARQCEPQGGQFALKIGVSGLALVGPAGAPGTFSTDLKIVVANVSDKKTVYQKSYKVAVNTNGGAHGGFELVADPILLPLTRTDLDSLYTVTIGFGNSTATTPKRRHS